MTKKYFSVILPVYINDKYNIFKKSFNSILNQTLKPKEIIILFDGPVDLKIKNFLKIKKKNKPFIKVLSFKENRGLGYILNYGVKKCKYDYVARCDADDFSRVDRFEKQMEYLANNPKIDVLGTNIYEINNNKIISKKKMKLNHKDISKQILFRNPINHSSVFFKKKKLIQSGNYKEMFYFEDYYMWFRMMNKGFYFNNLPDYLVFMNVDRNYFHRRTGVKYFRYYLTFLKTLYKKKLINFFTLLICFLIRLPIIIINTSILRLIYKTILR